MSEFIKYIPDEVLEEEINIPSDETAEEQEIVMGKIEIEEEKPREEILELFHEAFPDLSDERIEEFFHLDEALQSDEKLRVLINEVKRLLRNEREYYMGMVSQTYNADLRGTGSSWNHQEIARIRYRLPILENLLVALERERVKFLEPISSEELKNPDLEKIAVDPLRFNFDMVAEIPSEFHSDLMIKLVEKSKESTSESKTMLFNNLNRFKELDSKAALALMSLEKGGYVACNKLKHFKDLNDEVARKMLDGSIDYCASYQIGHGGIESFDNNLSNEVAVMLIRKGYFLTVMRSHRNFPNVGREFWLEMTRKGLIYPDVNPWIEEELGYSLQD